MKLGAPTTEVPVRGGSRDDGKYAEIYKKLDQLAASEWLPVSFETKKRAYNFRIAVETHRTRVMEASMRDRTVYVRNRVPASTSAKQRGGKS